MIECVKDKCSYVANTIYQQFSSKKRLSRPVDYLNILKKTGKVLLGLTIAISYLLSFLLSVVIVFAKYFFKFNQMIIRVFFQVGLVKFFGFEESFTNKFNEELNTFYDTTHLIN